MGSSHPLLAARIVQCRTATGDDMSAYYDYRLKFPVTGLATALQAIAALQSAGLLGAGDIPDNMLGDPRDNSGAIASSNITWMGRQGTTDPSYYYIHIRATVDPTTLPFDPATFGLVPSTVQESADVLGVWA